MLALRLPRAGSIMRIIAPLAALLLAARPVAVTAEPLSGMARQTVAPIKVGSGQSALERAAADLEMYRALIIDYRGGHDAAVATLLAWDHKRLNAAIGLIETPHDAARPWPAEHFRSAATMHTDAGIRRLNA